MPTTYTSLLGFALPQTGELTGTWGTVVNDSITKLVEASIAEAATADVSAGNWTLTTTGSGAANQARCAILIPTGTPGVSRNIIAPSSSKAYIVVNKSDAAVVLKGAATTGVSIPAGVQALCAWNGSDFKFVGLVDKALTTSTVDGTNLIGFRNIPAIADKVAPYTLQTSDVGKVVGVGTGGSIEIPDSVFSAGDAVLVFNNTSGAITITCTITTAYIAGTDADKATVSLATRGLANILFVSGTVCVITGNVS